MDERHCELYRMRLRHLWSLAWGQRITDAHDVTAAAVMIRQVLRSRND